MIFLNIPGTPVAKARARIGKWGAYTPRKTADAESLIAACARREVSAPLDGPLEMKCRFVFEPPKSWSRAKRLRTCGSWKTTRPDRDNLEKLVSDALNGIAFKDDSQIVAGASEKVYGQNAATYIWISPAPERGVRD